MIANIFKVIAALMVGMFVGLLLGILFGILLGLGLGFFFQEIVYSGQTVLMSIIVALILGSLLGSVAIPILNKTFEAHDNISIGSCVGIVVGFIVIFFHGVIDIPDPAVFDQTFYFVPIPYSVSVGAQIGIIIYPIFAAIAAIRDMIRSNVELRENQKREEERKYRISP